MTTRQDVYDAVQQISRAGCADLDALSAAADALTCPPEQLDGILERLHSRFPQVFKPEAAATPPAGPVQQGSAADAMKDAERRLSRQHSAAARFDRQVIDALLHAHKTTVEGRRALDGLEAEIESTMQRTDLNTAAGARQLQVFLLAKLAQIVAIVETANDDDNSKQALAAAWAALYAEQADGDPPGGGREPGPAVPPGPLDADADRRPGRDAEGYPEPPYGSYGYPDDAWIDDPDDPPGTPAHGQPAVSAPAAGPSMPAGPGFGGETPGAAGLPAGGVPTGLIPTGWRPGSQRPDPAADPDDGWPAAEQTADASTGAEDRDDRVDPVPPDADPRVVTLPDGQTVTAATAQLGAVVQAAADGTPIAEAFRRQGITIPPPGTAVTAPLDQSRLVVGDIGVFTDRHALALGSGRALLDGQIQHVANVRGPSFLGWQHPPGAVEPPAADHPPAPTRPAAAVPV